MPCRYNDFNRKRKSDYGDWERSRQNKEAKYSMHNDNNYTQGISPPGASRGHGSLLHGAEPISPPGTHPVGSMPDLNNSH